MTSPSTDVVPEVRKDAVLSEDGVYRYALLRSWDDNLPRDVWIMLNPSTADAYVDDRTIGRCMSFSRSWGAGGIRVVNLFALRATNPAELAKHPDPVGPSNDQILHFSTVDRSWDPSGPGRVIAAWGAHPMARERAKQVDLGRLTLCLGVTKDGHPRHPLYVKGDTALVPYGFSVTAGAE